jgi:transcriptional regulator with GAF, ATPase, and Fis domain
VLKKSHTDKVSPVQSINNNKPPSGEGPGYQGADNPIEKDFRTSHRFLEIANRHTEMTPLLEEFIAEIRKITGCEAVGMRILDGNGHIPYQAYAGFSKQFYEQENALSIECDQCMCTSVIKGMTDPDLPFYTSRGSFHINGTTRFLSTVSKKVKGQTRNACNRFGYESVALIPIRLDDRILGLIHLADSRENMISLQTVERFEWTAQQLAMTVQRIKAEESLKESEDRLRQLGDNLPGGMIYRLVHRPDGSRSCTYASKGCERMFQIKAGDIIKNVDIIYDMFPPEQMERVVMAEKESIESLDLFNFESPMILPNGETRWFRWHSKPRRLADGTYLWDGVCLDINRRKQAEEALRNARDTLEVQVQERTGDLAKTNKDLRHEIKNRKQVERDLRNAYSEIEALKVQLEADHTYLREEIKLAHNYENIIGSSDMLKYVLFRAEQIAPTDTTVLILGETGTGKELIARAIHHASSRRDRPLIKVDCASLPANLIESELFGHEKGAFTGAVQRRVGRFELADGATLFLDEIGELPLDLQSKLLRVLQDGEFERLGSSQTLRTDIRVIAATNRNLEADVREKLFRMDLWYRLSVFTISIPPLRERSEDIGLLVNHMIKRLERKLGKRIKSVPSHVLTRLQNYSWPGNVRELENVIERAVINTQGDTLQLEETLDVYRSGDTVSPDLPIKSLDEMEREHILLALMKANWIIHGEAGAAALLDINPSTLRGRMRKQGIHRPPYKT